MRITLIALTAAAIAAPAVAGITDASVIGTDITSLTLPVDGVWNGQYGTRSNKAPGQDWGFITEAGGSTNGDRIWVDEVWTGANVGNTLEVGVLNPGRSDPTINLNKKVDNQTGYTWTGFTMVLQTALGNVNVLSASSTTFSSWSVLNNNSAAVTLVYSGGSVPAGGIANFDFSFSVPIAGFWTFTVTQTPVPSAGSFAILGMGALVAGRRRR